MGKLELPKATRRRAVRSPGPASRMLTIDDRNSREHARAQRGSAELGRSRCEPHVNGSHGGLVGGRLHGFAAPLVPLVRPSSGGRRVPGALEAVSCREQSVGEVFRMLPEVDECLVLR